LDEAAKICMRGLVKASTLRAAAARGDLVVEKIGKRLITTPANIEAWRERCRVPAREKPNGSAFRAASQRRPEEDMQRSIAACRATIEKLKNQCGRRSKAALVQPTPAAKDKAQG